MGFDTWMPKHYPVSAADLFQELMELPVIDDQALLRHAYKKWEGMTPEILKEHGLYLKNEHRLKEKDGKYTQLLVWALSLCGKLQSVGAGKLGFPRSAAETNSVGSLNPGGFVIGPMPALRFVPSAASSTNGRHTQMKPAPPLSP